MKLRKDFIIDNKADFEKLLLEEAVHVRDKIDQIKLIGNINLLDNAFNFVLSVVGNKQEAVTELGTKEGITWARHNLTLDFKLEWIQAIRKTLWKLLYEFDHLGKKQKTKEEYYNLQVVINSLIDEFFRVFLKLFRL